MVPCAILLQTDRWGSPNAKAFGPQQREFGGRNGIPTRSSSYADPDVFVFNAQQKRPALGRHRPQCSRLPRKVDAKGSDMAEAGASEHKSSRGERPVPFLGKYPKAQAFFPTKPPPRNASVNPKVRSYRHLPGNFQLKFEHACPAAPSPPFVLQAGIL